MDCMSDLKLCVEVFIYLGGDISLQQESWNVYMIVPHFNTDHGQVYTWGWKECVPSGNTTGDSATSNIQEKDVLGYTNLLVGEQGIFRVFLVHEIDYSILHDKSSI